MWVDTRHRGHWASRQAAASKRLLSVPPASMLLVVSADVRGELDCNVTVNKSEMVGDLMLSLLRAETQH